MDFGQQSWALITAALALGVFTLLGLGLLFARATNIERPAMVGGATLLGCLLGMVLLWLVYREGGPYNWWQAVVVIALPVLTFGLSRVIDRMLGDKELDPESDEKTYGAHLSD